MKYYLLMRLKILILAFIASTSSVYAVQPGPNSCKYDEAGASEITCKGYVKLLEDTPGTVVDAFQIVESRMWKAALEFCESISKSYETRRFNSYAPDYIKGEVWMLGGFRCASAVGIK